MLVGLNKTNGSGTTSTGLDRPDQVWGQHHHQHRQPPHPTPVPPALPTHTPVPPARTHTNNNQPPTANRQHQHRQQPPTASTSTGTSTTISTSTSASVTAALQGPVGSGARVACSQPDTCKERQPTRSLLLCSCCCSGCCRRFPSPSSTLARWKRLSLQNNDQQSRMQWRLRGSPPEEVTRLVTCAACELAPVAAAAALAVVESFLLPAL